MTAIFITPASLKKALSSAVRVTERAALNPENQVIKISANALSSEIEIVAYNHLGGITTTSSAMLCQVSTKDLTARIDPHKLTALLATFDDDAVVKIEKENSNNVIVSCGTFSLTVPITVHDTEPLGLTQLSHTSCVVDVKASDLLGAAKACLPSISNEATRYHLHGVCFRRDHDDKLSLTSTDGHTLTRVTFNAKWLSDTKLRHIVHKSAVKELIALLKSATGPIATLHFNDTELMVELGGVTVIIKFINGNFPDADRVIPQIGAQGSCLVRFKAIDVVRVCRRAVAAVSHDRSRGISIAYGKKTGLTITSKSEKNGKMKDTLPCEPQLGSSNATFGVNSKLFMQQVEAFGGADVEMQFSDPGAPLLLMSKTSKLNTICVIMPMRL